MSLQTLAGLFDPTGVLLALLVGLCVWGLIRYLFSPIPPDPGDYDLEQDEFDGS